MPVSFDAVSFKMIIKGEELDAVMTVTQSKGYKDARGWKAHVRVSGHRHFGSWRPSISEAVNATIQSHCTEISATETKRLHQVSSSMQARRSDTVVTHLASAGPSGGTSPVALSQVRCKSNAVYCVHQIYGIYADNKPMNAMFQKSTEMWKQVASDMDAHYHLWSASDLEALLKQRYPQYWDMYKNVRYPVMRVDIGRILILHAFGGIYADCDIFPNRSFYEQVELAVQRVPEIKEKKKTLPSAKKGRGSQPRTTCDYFIDMEVIVAAQGNPILLELLDFILQEITRTKYKTKDDIYYTWRMRYIWQTTGPRAMARFFKRHDIAPKVAGLKFLECNHFKNTEMIQNEKRCLDVISNISNSYFTDKHEIHVPVGEGDAQIPLVHTRRRMHGKKRARAMVVQLYVAPSQEKSLPSADDATSTQGGPQSAKLKNGERENSTGVDAINVHDGECGGVNMPSSAHESIVVSMNHVREVAKDREHLRELRAYIANHNRTIAVQLMLEDVSEELKGWLTEGLSSSSSAEALRLLCDQPSNTAGSSVQTPTRQQLK